MVSNLILDFSETNDIRTLRVSDASFYSKGLDIECGLLEVIPPGYVSSVNFNVDKGFSTVLNSSNLKLSKVRVYKDLTALPDGVYTFKYSIKPNADAWVQYDYLRINSLLKQYNQHLCHAKLNCLSPDKKTRDEIKRLSKIKFYLDYAKVQVEECGNRNSGIELYNYAKELLNTTSCLTCK